MLRKASFNLRNAFRFGNAKTKIQRLEDFLKRNDLIVTSSFSQPFPRLPKGEYYLEASQSKEMSSRLKKILTALEKKKRGLEIHFDVILFHPIQSSLVSAKLRENNNDLSARMLNALNVHGRPDVHLNPPIRIFLRFKPK